LFHKQIKLKRLIKIFYYWLIASTGQDSIASLTQGNFFCDLTFAFAPLISKTSGQIDAQLPHPMHAELIFITIKKSNR
jgi:hypothetical protein